jgi:hypothetical protein
MIVNTTHLRHPSFVLARRNKWRISLYLHKLRGRLLRGGLEGCKPSKNRSLSSYTGEKEIFAGGLPPPKPPPPKSGYL